MEFNPELIGGTDSTHLTRDSKVVELTGRELVYSRIRLRLELTLA
jgi:hypothetical protein